jgi:hypothetical protein
MDIVKLRLFCRLINVAEYLFYAVVFVFSYFYVKTPFCLICGMLMIFLSIILSEFVSFLAYQYEKLEPPLIHLLILLFCCELYALAPGFRTLAAFPIAEALKIVSLAVAILTLLRIPFAMRKKVRNDSAAFKGIKFLKPGKHRQLRLLLRKECSLLRQDNKQLFVSPVVYLVLFYLFGNAALVPQVLPFYFVLEFSLLYGFNYFGHDQDALLLILLSPVDKAALIRAKNMCLLSLSFVYTLIAYLIGIVTRTIALNQSLPFWDLAMLVMGSMLFLCPYYAVKFYYNAKGTKKYNIQSLISFLVIFIILSLMQYFLRMQVNHLLCTVISCVFFVLALSVNFFHNDYQGSLLKKQERKILDEIGFL